MPLGDSGRVVRLPRRCGRGQEVLLKVWEESGGPFKGTEVLRRPL